MTKLPNTPRDGADIERETGDDGLPVNDAQVDPNTGKPVHIAPDGELSEREIDSGKTADESDSLRIDPNSGIPRPVQPDLA